MNVSSEYLAGNSSQVVTLSTNYIYEAVLVSNMTFPNNLTRLTTSSIPQQQTDNITSGSFQSHDALLYIVFVLLFYAFSIVILMVKYIRREREEAEMATYYAEFVSREKFKTPQYEIQCYMKKFKLGPFTDISICKQSTSKENSTDDDDFVSCLDAPLVCSETETVCSLSSKSTPNSWSIP